MDPTTVDVHIDAGLAAYRTMLSWRRTALTVIVVTLTAAASTLWQARSPAVLIVAAITLLGPLWWVIALVQGRHIWNAVLHPERSFPAFVTMSATVAVTAIALTLLACLDATHSAG